MQLHSSQDYRSTLTGPRVTPMITKSVKQPLNQSDAAYAKEEYAANSLLMVMMVAMVRMMILQQLLLMMMTMMRMVKKVADEGLVCCCMSEPVRVSLHDPGAVILQPRTRN